ncbi:hypothetical protein ABGB18_46890 [Nonomuraea sp. B12E4]|uniref:hypothetical protein n=1 Tax=Nonomuraea sp. B12E4 TaxID=3153564 RepID=UPI00325D0296
MSPKSFARTAVVAAALALTGVSLSAQPASADQVVLDFLGAQGAFDNNPGNGAESWVWIWSGTSGAAGIEYRFYDNTSGYLEVIGHHTSATRFLDRDVWRIRLCVGSDRVKKTCSAWT